MNNRRPLTERLEVLSHNQREQNIATLILCELTDELIQATDRQSELLAAYLEQGAGPGDGGNDRGGCEAAPAPAEPPTTTDPGQQEEGDTVLLREPAVPPVDDDPDDTGGRPVAEPATEPKAPAGRAAKKATPAKATRRRSGT